MDGGEKEDERRVSAGRITGVRERMGLVEEMGGLSGREPVECHNKLSHQLAVPCHGRVCLC